MTTAVKDAPSKPEPPATKPAAPERLNSPGMGAAIVSEQEPPAPPVQPAKAAQQPAGASPSPRGPMRKPVKAKVGDWALIWEPDGPGKLRPFPFQLIQQDMAGLWHGNVHKLNRLVQRHSKEYSATPKLGCWSWPDD